jgi:ABC-type nickel/cobalt efflux system permease component RcnA
MFGLDDYLASFSDGASLLVVLAVAVLLGLRHATDPDHVAAVTTLLATKGSRAWDAARLGAAWGLGHAITLFAFGLPIVIYNAYLPDGIQRAAETAVGVLIIGLAVWLLYRWWRGGLHVHEHAHGNGRHAHLHSHEDQAVQGHEHRPARSPVQALGIGLLHGMGGSAGVGILLVSTIDGTAIAVAALAMLALFTAVSMTVLTTGFGMTLTSRPLARSYATVAPALGLASLAFGVWYALGAQEVLPYYF